VVNSRARTPEFCILPSDWVYNVFVYEALIVLLLVQLCMSVCDSQPLTKFFAERKQMVEEQLVAPGREIKNQRVLDAMATVPRRRLVHPLMSGVSVERMNYNVCRTE